VEDPTLYQPVKMGKGALSEQVARQIIELIANKRLGAGTRLPSLDELTGYLGVSRTAVREAIKLLDAWGVVTVKHGVGTFVAEPGGDALTVPFRVSVERGEESIRNLLQVRETLEPGIAALAAANASSEHIAEMEEALQTMDRSLATPDEYNKADMTFHLALAKATGNDLFLLVIYPVIDLFQDLFNLAHRVPGAAARGQDFHRIILKYVKTKNADEAREAMQAHIKQVWSEVQPQLDEVDNIRPAESGRLPAD
jgi:GntR family transcriptional repressor for pyruvate dehydrogenase complex